MPPNTVDPKPSAVGALLALLACLPYAVLVAALPDATDFPGEAGRDADRVRVSGTLGLRGLCPDVGAAVAGVVAGGADGGRAPLSVRQGAHLSLPRTRLRAPCLAVRRTWICSTGNFLMWRGCARRVAISTERLRRLTRSLVG